MLGMEASHDAKRLLTTLALLGFGLGAYCRFGSTKADPSKQSSLPGLGMGG